MLVGFLELRSLTYMEMGLCSSSLMKGSRGGEVTRMYHSVMCQLGFHNEVAAVFTPGLTTHLPAQGIPFEWVQFCSLKDRGNAEASSYTTLSPMNLTVGFLFQGAPKPIAIEPCAGNRAAVLTVFLCLPRGTSGAPPPGQSGMMHDPTAVSNFLIEEKKELY